VSVPLETAEEGGLVDPVAHPIGGNIDGGGQCPCLGGTKSCQAGDSGIFQTGRIDGPDALDDGEIILLRGPFLDRRRMGSHPERGWFRLAGKGQGYEPVSHDPDHRAETGEHRGESKHSFHETDHTKPRAGRPWSGSATYPQHPCDSAQWIQPSWLTSQAETAVLAWALWMSAPAHPAAADRSAQKRGSCWNNPAAPEEGLVARGSQRDSQYATSKASSTSCGWKNRAMMPRTSASLSPPSAGWLVVVVAGGTVVVVLVGTVVVVDGVGMPGETARSGGASSGLVVVTSGRSPSRSEIRASSAGRSEKPGAERNPLLKARATTRPEVEPQSAPADSGVATVVDVVVMGVVCGEKAANPATATAQR